MEQYKEKRISFVIPCYNSELTLEEVIDELRQRMAELTDFDYEVILVNDYSKDGTLNVICSLCERYDNIMGISLAKNFGQHAAILAGFECVSGEYIICLDDDGQMPLEAIAPLIAKLEEGMDVVIGKYKEIHQSCFRRFGNKINAYMCEWLIAKPKNLVMNSFWGARRFVIDEMLQYKGAYPYIAGLILRTTQNICNIDVDHRDRRNGTSGYSFAKLIRLWMNGFTAFSEIPLRFASICGIVCAFVGMIFTVVTIVRKLLNPNILMGYSSLIAVILFIGGVIMLLLGILGEYIGRMYICMNQSPQYVVRDRINIHGKEEK